MELRDYWDALVRGWWLIAIFGLAGLAVGTYGSTDELADTFHARRVVAPAAGEPARRSARERWLEARAKAEGTIPELSGISF